MDSVVDFILTLFFEISIKSYINPEIFSSAQKIYLKRLFDSRDIKSLQKYEATAKRSP